jgi:hypothetical protein
MGVVSKQFNKRITAQLLVPVEVVGRFVPAKAMEVAKYLAEGYERETGTTRFWNSSGFEYSCETQANGSQIIACHSPNYVQRQRPIVHWSAGVRAWPDEPQTRVRLAILRYRTVDGLLCQKKAYEQYRDHLIEQLRQLDPGLEWLAPTEAPR